MSTTSSSSENTEAKKANKTAESMPAPPPPQKSGSGLASTLAFFAFILSVAAGGGIYWMWQQLQLEKTASSDSVASLQQQLESELQKTQANLKSELEQAKSEIVQEVTKTQEQIQQELKTKAEELKAIAQKVELTAEDKIAAAQANLTKAQAELAKAVHEIELAKKRQKSLETSIEGLYARLGNTSADWAIAEADYLLKVANHRLQLEQDVTTALEALELADKRLKSLDDPALNEVRNIIAQEIISLQTLPQPDREGINMQLAELQNKVDQLPLKGRTQPTHQDRTQVNEAPPKLEGWAAVPVAIVDTLKDMVVVNYNDKPVEPLLSTEQIDNLKENLKLKLEQARIVALRGDEKLYKENLELAKEWAQKYFNTEDVTTKKFLDTLAYLETKQVEMKVPDISGSLRSLRKVAKRMELNLPSLENNNAQNGAEANNVAMK